MDVTATSASAAHRDSSSLSHAATSRLGGRFWWALVIVGLAGQLAWTIENMYLNVFVYDTITDNPQVLAAMVATSAIAATLATLLVGAISDRVGKRRVFISVGYILWGISTTAFGWLNVDEFATAMPTLTSTGRSSPGQFSAPPPRCSCPT